MVEFAHFTKQFKDGWKGKESKRRALLGDLMEIIRTHSFRKFGCIVENKIFEQAWSRKQRERYHINAYALAGMTCAAQVYKWFLDEPTFHGAEVKGLKTLPIKFVYEDGDKGQGKLIERFKADLYQVPGFELKKDKQTSIGLRRAFVPLQAADFLAYEIFLACKGVQDPKYKPRWGLLEFDRMMGSIGKYEVPQIQALETVYEMPLKERSLYSQEDWNVLIGKTK